MFGQVLLPQEDVQTEHPRVLHALGKDPDVAGALHVVGTAHQSSRPLDQPLEVNMVAERQGGLTEGKESNFRAKEVIWEIARYITYMMHSSY